MYGGGKWAQLHNSDGDTEVEDAHEGDRRLRRSVSDDMTRLLARPFGYLEDSGTSHLSVIDKDGNAVAMTSSVNQIFGSYVFSESTGVLLGNTMDGKSKL
jgi:gamma-glutamyltranspeptidase